MMEAVRFIIAAVLMFAGVLCMGIAVFGMFRFKYVLNRMHMAAMIDTFGIFFCILGLIIWNGLNLESLKLALIIGFFWVSGPVSSHLIGRMEVSTNEKLSEECEVKEYGEL